MIMRFGDEKSLFGKSAVAQLTGALLMRGTKNKSRQQIQDETDRLKARVNVSGGLNFASAGIETTEANLAGALRLAAEILREPSFPENEFEQVRQQRIAGIEAGKSDPQGLAFLEYSRHLAARYPRGDVRYVPTSDEQIEDLKKVTLDDVRKFYAQFYGASVGEFAVSGQFDKAEVQKLAAELLGNWKSPGPTERILNPYQKIEAVNRKIEAPDKQNAFFITGGPFKMSDEDPDYPAMRDGQLYARRYRGCPPLQAHSRERGAELCGPVGSFRAHQGRRRHLHRPGDRSPPERSQGRSQLQGRTGPDA